MRTLGFGVLALVVACGGGNGTDVDAGAGEPEPASTDHCSYTPLPATAGAGGTVTGGAIRVGIAERALGLPVGSALGGNTSRAVAIDGQGKVDGRRAEISGQFTPSVGFETIPMAKAIAFEAGDERVVLIHTDTIFSDDSITHEVAGRLGPDYHGKVIWTSSHTHTAAEQYTADLKLQVGGGVLRGRNRTLLMDAITATAEAAIADLAPAHIGIAVDTDFDPDHAVSYDRRDENDHLFGGKQAKDSFLAVMRIDTPEGTPRAILPIFGVHSAILDDDASVFSTDVSGMYERLLEEEFDAPITVIHLQGAAGDVLPSSQRHVQQPSGEPDWDFARSEENARRALPSFLALWEQAGAAMQSEAEMEMVTRSVEVGPNWETFTVRDGALAYAPFVPGRPADRKIYEDDGSIASPIDEFNARFGAGLCGDDVDDLFQGLRMPNVDELVSYNSCAVLPDVLLVLSALIDVQFDGPPICASTRTTVSAWRFGDYLFATAPGEPLVLWADYVRSLSPVAPDKTIVLGYAQGHIGYILTAEDWLTGGFEPSINLWGPLEGELVAERLAEVMRLVVTPAREDAAAGGTDRLANPTVTDDDVPPPDPAPLAGTVPDAVPESVYVRGRVVLETAQPAPVIPRVTGVARFAWIGEDPLSGTPQVTLEREVSDGVFAPVTRRSGRPVRDLDMIVVWSPDPLRRQGAAPRTHYWTVEWQAVQPLGAPGASALADRPGVPLGRYRFAVNGTGYSLASDPFEVVPGPLAVSATVVDDEVQVTAGYDAAAGWRLLAMDGLSNAFVPAGGTVSVEVRYGAGEPAAFENVPVDAAGAARVSPASVAGITEVRVVDRFGNAGAASM